MKEDEEQDRAHQEEKARQQRHEDKRPGREGCEGRRSK